MSFVENWLLDKFEKNDDDHEELYFYLQKIYFPKQRNKFDAFIFVKKNEIKQIGQFHWFP